MIDVLSMEPSTSRSGVRYLDKLSGSYSIPSISESQAPPLKLSRASKDILFGSIAGMVSKVFEHPFDLVKVRLQTQSSEGPAMYRGAFDCFRQTYTKEGIRGLYRGLSMPVFGATLENATLFFTYNFVQGHLRSINGSLSSSSTFTSTSSIEADAERPLTMGQLSIAAACAGAATSFVLTPVELIKCKMQVQMISREIDILSGRGGRRGLQSSSPSSIAKTATIPTRTISTKAFAGLDGPVKLITDTLRREGLSGLWLGQTGTLIRETGGAIAWFLGFEWACRTMIESKKKRSGQGNISKKDLSSLQLIGAGALAGVSYNVVLFPADSVKSTMQTERELSGGRPNADGSAWKKTGFLSTFKRIYETKGIRGLYAGCLVTCMRSAPSSALIFLLYNRLEGLADDFGI